MNPALLFLVWRSFVHGTRTRILRLKNPRYLVPFLLGAAYFAFLFLGPFAGRDRDPLPPHPDEGRRAMLMAEWIGAAFAFVMAAGAWLLPSRRSPLAFLEAEVSMLFPAPLTRRELVTFKILEILKVLVISGAFIAVFVLLNSGPLRAASVFANTTIYLGILSLHNVGANLTRRSLFDHGLAGWKRMGLPIAVVGGIIAAVVFGMPPLPYFGDYETAPRGVIETRIFDWIDALGASPAGWALLPFRILGRPLFAPDLLSLLGSVAMLLPIAALLYWWVVRTDAAFEEAAAEQAVDLGRRIEAYKAGKGWRSALGTPGSTRRAPWRLSPEGPPETAFAWKSAAESVRAFSPRLLGFLIAALIVGVALAKDFVGPENEGRMMATVGACCLALAAFLMFGGPSVLGSSLRQDLEQVEFLKTIPISPARLVRCSLLGAILPTAILQAFFVLAAACVMPAPKGGDLSLAWRISGAGALLAVLPSATAVIALADAAGALWFPAWIRPGQAPAQGPEAMGHMMVLMLGKGALLFVGLLVPGIAAVVLVGVTAAVGGETLLPSAVWLAGMLTAVLVAVELWLASFVVGRRFARLDAAEEGILS